MMRKKKETVADEIPAERDDFVLRLRECFDDSRAEIESTAADSGRDVPLCDSLADHSLRRMRQIAEEFGGAFDEDDMSSMSSEMAAWSVIATIATRIRRTGFGGVLDDTMWDRAITKGFASLMERLRDEEIHYDRVTSFAIVLLGIEHLNRLPQDSHWGDVIPLLEKISPFALASAGLR